MGQNSLFINDSSGQTAKSQTQLDKAIAEMRKQWVNTQKELSASVQVSKEYLSKQMKEYKEICNVFKNANNDYFSFRKLVTETLSGNPSKISEKYQKYKQDSQNDNQQDSQNNQNTQNFLADQEEAEKKESYKNSFVGGATQNMSSEFSSGLRDMIKGYKDFSDVMKSMTASLADYMLKTLTDSISKMIFSENNMGALLNFGTGLLDGIGGGLKTVGGFFKGLFKHHSGGVIPSGASYSLPGTQEQLALLKGGERVLSPSENTSYEGGQNSSPVVFNSFNVKAWDSKDVQKYLLENKQLLNSITYEGIKNNNCRLRSMVQNA